MWLGAGSALAAMVGTSWYVVAVNGAAPGGDMIGHAAAAEWLRTLPWWDWRGWSDWFYGGQAIGVNYPPLGHAWMRYTDPYHGQMAAVAIGLLVLLPWGALRLARASGYGPRAQRAAVAAVLVLVAASANLHWILSGFHSEHTFYGSWPAMVSTVIGLHAATGAARADRPLASGVLAGLAVLFNATVVPGIAAVCAVLLATSGASFTRALRWAATAGAAAVAVSAWWLVPFLAGWDRLVRWEVRLFEAWTTGALWQGVVLAAVPVVAAWSAKRSGPARRLALAALAGLAATVAADLAGYLRPERWLELPILLCALAAGGLLASRSAGRAPSPARPAWTVLGVAFLVVVVVVTLRLEMVPLAIWLMRGSRRSWAWGSALAWAAVLALVPLWSQLRSPAPSEPAVAPLEAAALSGGSDAAGLVSVDHLYNTVAGDVRDCRWGFPWDTTAATGGRLRPLHGLYQETSPTAEFLTAEVHLRIGRFNESGRVRPHWFDVWQEAGSPPLDNPVRAEALGARWYATCGSDRIPSMTELPGALATGVSVAPQADEESWHRAAIGWWISIGTDHDEGPFPATPQSRTVPVLWAEEDQRYPIDQAAKDVTLRTGEDSLSITAQAAGWVWVRVPWDPDWRSADGAPVTKGGPGHLVVWADRGPTELRWDVPGTVDVAAAGITGLALLATAGLAVVNRRRGWVSDPDRARPAAHAVGVFADTVDGCAQTAAQHLRRLVGRYR